MFSLRKKVAACGVLAASLGASAAAPAAPLAGPSLATRTPIKHVIVVVMENRSFDNLFHGFPGANTATSGLTHDGKTQPLQATPYEGTCDPDHSHEAWQADYDAGKMDGFDLKPPSCLPNLPPNPLNPNETAAQYPYGFLPYAEIKPYWDVASQYAVADNMFASQTGPSYPGHMFIVAGTSANQTDDPSDALDWGCDAPPGTTVPYLDRNGNIAGTTFPCVYKQPTMGNLLDAHHIPWAYYSNNLSYVLLHHEYSISTQPYDAFDLVRNGPDWQKDVVVHEGVPFEFLDILTGNLPPVSWFNPPIVASDHPQATTSLGPDYVALLVDALRLSPANYWKDTAVFVTWDDPGGWYDHVAPAQLDSNGLGFRVPLIAVSRYAKRGYVSHVRHEYGSLLKFVEYNWNLPSLGTTDARSDDLTDMFDFSRQNGNRPTKYIAPINPGSTLGFFESLPFDTAPLDYTPQER